ncbi:MAG TPA: response regulator transcription factor [Bryobacteraceae bacterium]|nr:response regulator transcription factor [Bryobacteraceae bacterium]
MTPAAVPQALTPKRIRILLADDDLRVRKMARELLQPEFDVVDMVSDGEALVAAALRLRPDVIVTDISMPAMSGIEAVRQIRSVMPEIKFVFFTMHDANGYRREAQSAGAVGYVLKSSAREELNQTIRNAMADSD